MSKKIMLVCAFALVFTFGSAVSRFSLIHCAYGIQAAQKAISISSEGIIKVKPAMISIGFDFKTKNKSSTTAENASPKGFEINTAINFVCTY